MRHFLLLSNYQNVDWKFRHKYRDSILNKSPCFPDYFAYDITEIVDSKSVHKTYFHVKYFFYNKAFWMIISTKSLILFIFLNYRDDQNKKRLNVSTITKVSFYFQLKIWSNTQFIFKVTSFSTKNIESKGSQDFLHIVSSISLH